MKPLIVVFSLVSAWTVACNTASYDGLSTANRAATVVDFADRYCQIIEPCCADAGLSTTGKPCRDQIVSMAYPPSGELSGQYNLAAGQDCLSAMLAASKNSAFCSDFVGFLPQCDYVFGGEVAVYPGESCTSDFDCAVAAGGSALCFMQTSGGGSTGTCVQTQTGAAGQGPCVATVVQGVPMSVQWSGPPLSTGYTCDVADGVSCDPTTHECTALAATGHPCQADPDCVTSDYCASGSCRPRVAVGAPCGDTSGPECVNTAYCDFSSSVCNPLLPDGSACTGSFMCQSYACNNGTCASVSNGNVQLAMTCGT